MDDTNIKENHLGNKNLDKWGNSVFAQNLLRYLDENIEKNVNFNCFMESYDEYESKHLSENLTDWFIRRRFERYSQEKPKYCFGRT